MSRNDVCISTYTEMPKPDIFNTYKGGLVNFRLTEHARERANERGTTENEIDMVLSRGQEAQLKKGRKGKEMIFNYNKDWLGKYYPQKKVKVVYVEEGVQAVVITVKVYYGEWR